MVMIKQILKIHLLSLSVFTLFRIVLLFSNKDSWGNSILEILQSLWMGLRFDTVINCYILALPSLIWMLIYIMGKSYRIINHLLYVYCAVLFSLAYIVSGFDIPYFNQFFSRLDKVAFQWIDSPMFILEMVTKDFRLWGYAIPFGLLFLFFHFFLKRIFKNIHHLEITRKRHWVLKLGLSLIFLGFTFIGIRGRIEQKSPIREGTAYFSNNAFLNKIGLNPNFTLINSLLEKEKEWSNLMSPSLSYARVQKDLYIKNKHTSSIATLIEPEPHNFGKPNMIVVIMEAMTSYNMAYFGNKKGLTPVLDRLVSESIFFENTYSSGIHTFNGVYSTLFSYPALWDEHPMKTIRDHKGIVEILKQNDYTTAYFTTHDGQFDNIEGFLKGNNFQHVFKQNDYPISEVHSNLGVTDDYLFRYSIGKINEFHQRRKPFFCALMTASNHAPIVIPDYFQSPLKEETERVVQYADWSIGEFLKQAKQEPWFKNTIFVFVADHGTSYDKTYDMSLSYNHIPLFFYAPYLFEKAEIRKDFVQQIDVMPSLMGLTNMHYIKNNMGINIWQQKRPFAYFSADDKIGVINDEYFLIYKKEGQQALYKYREKGHHNYANKIPQLVSEMKNYAFSHIQIAHETQKKLR